MVLPDSSQTRRAKAMIMVRHERRPIHIASTFTITAFDMVPSVNHFVTRQRQAGKQQCQGEIVVSRS